MDGNCFGRDVDDTIYNAPSYDIYLECCVNGTARGIVPRVAARSKLESGEIIELQPERFLPGHSIGKTSAQAGKSLQSFERMLIDAAKNSLLSIGQMPIGSNQVMTKRLSDWGLVRPILRFDYGQSAHKCKGAHN